MQGIILTTCTNLDFFQPGSDNLLNILKKKWWKYILLGLADVEANYLIVRAYQYTTLTSVQVRSPLTSLGFIALREESELICAHLILLRTCSFEENLNTGGCYLFSSGAYMLMSKASWNYWKCVQVNQFPNC